MFLIERNIKIYIWNEFHSCQMQTTFTFGKIANQRSKRSAKSYLRMNTQGVGEHF